MMFKSAIVSKSVPVISSVPATRCPFSTYKAAIVPDIGAKIDVLVSFSFASLSVATALLIENSAPATPCFADSTFAWAIL